MYQIREWFYFFADPSSCKAVEEDLLSSCVEILLILHIKFQIKNLNFE